MQTFKKFFKNLTLKAEKSKIYSDVDGLSLQNLFYANNGYFPNCHMFARGEKTRDYEFDTKAILNYLKENSEDDFEYVVYVSHYLFDDKRADDKIGICIVDTKNNIYARIENYVTESYILYGNDGEEALDNFLEILKKFYAAPPVEENNCYRIAQTDAGFRLLKKKISEKKLAGFAIETHYNDDFIKEDAKIDKFISADETSGLVILHGDKGTGKTTYIRHLVHAHPEKKFVWVTPDLMDCLGRPEFGTFLETLKDYVIILEDCEAVIKSRESNIGSSSAVTLLLNMTDGLLSDDLHIKFVCTFNADTKNIDQALLRKGRCVSMYEFKPLTPEKANVILEQRWEEKCKELTDGEDVPVKYETMAPMTLADIYFLEDDSYTTKRKAIF